MIFVFYFFAAVLVWLSFRSFRGGITYLRFFRDEIAKPGSEFTPFVTVIAPCRGLDKGLEENLNALVIQDYPEYEVIFVVDSKEDAALRVIESVLNKAVGSNVGTKLVIAPTAKGCAQKIENLREAVLHTDGNSQAFVFVDSDARPSPGWLRALIAPLADETVGAASGYRWFISNEPTFASELRSVWNASIASSLGPNAGSNFCWGGSTALRRDVFERIGMRDRWQGTLSDDFAVTRVLNEEGLPIVFVPQALTASIENCTFAELLEFTTRQLKITRVYMPKLWIMSFVGSALFNVVMIASLFIIITGGPNRFAMLIGSVTLLLVSVFSIGKAWLRLNAVKLVLTQFENQLQRQFWTQTTLWAISPTLFLFNCLAAWLSRRVTWRGITYELKSAGETVIISH